LPTKQKKEDSDSEDTSDNCSHSPQKQFSALTTIPSISTASQTITSNTTPSPRKDSHSNSLSHSPRKEGLKGSFTSLPTLNSREPLRQSASASSTTTIQPTSSPGLTTSASTSPLPSLKSVSSDKKKKKIK